MEIVLGDVRVIRLSPEALADPFDICIEHALEIPPLDVGSYNVVIEIGGKEITFRLNVVDQGVNDV